MLILEAVVGLHLSFFSIPFWGIDLDYCNTEWFALETNRDHSDCTQVLHLDFCWLHGLLHSSKGFLPIAVDRSSDPTRQTTQDLPVSVQESPEEVWVGGGLLQGQRHWDLQGIAKVQLQQPGIQPEEMDGVGDETASHFSMDCLFISSLRFSFILLQKH